VYVGGRKGQAKEQRGRGVDYCQERTSSEPLYLRFPLAPLGAVGAEAAGDAASLGGVRAFKGDVVEIGVI